MPVSEMGPADGNADAIRDSSPSRHAHTAAEAASVCEWRAEFMIVATSLDLHALYAGTDVEG